MAAIKTERAHERAARLAREVGARTAKAIPTGEVKTMMESIAILGGRDVETAPAVAIDETCRAPITLTELQRGDVFIAKVTGGKVRPWVVLGVCGENVSAVTMSSGPTAPNVVRTKCRLWPNSWIGTTISLFEIEYAAREVTRPYTNLPHLREIEKIIAQGFRPTPADRVKSLAEIRGRRFFHSAQETVQ